MNFIGHMLQLFHHNVSCNKFMAKDSFWKKKIALSQKKKENSYTFSKQPFKYFNDSPNLGVASRHVPTPKKLGCKILFPLMLATLFELVIWFFLKMNLIMSTLIKCMMWMTAECLAVERLWRNPPLLEPLQLFRFRYKKKC